VSHTNHAKGALFRKLTLLSLCVGGIRRTEVDHLNVRPTISLESRSDLSREKSIVLFHDPSPDVPTGVPQLVGKWSVDDYVLDPDVRRRNRDLP
jgi:hypothetical protein